MTADLGSEIAHLENEVAALRRAYDILINVSAGKISLLGQAEHDRDQYRDALRRVEALVERCSEYGTVRTDAVRKCYADVPGVAS